MKIKRTECWKNKLLIPLLLLMFITILTPPIASAHEFFSGHVILVNQVQSLNWAGYVVASSFSSPRPVVTEVYGSWIVQSVVPSKTATYSSQWIGIGGFFSGDNSLIQTGTLSYSNHGNTYYSAWYELLPAPSTTISNFKVKPGDIMQAEIFVVKIINSTTQEWNITLNDLTEHEHFSILVNYSSSLLSAEWIEERPEVNGHLSTLADFNISYYGNYYTGVPYTNYADVNGQFLPIGDLPYESITMVNNNGAILAQPSALVNLTSFYVTYG